MKKIFFAVGVILIFLSGCSVKKSLSEETYKYLVSAIGFDKAQEGIDVSLEVLVINSENFEEDISPVIISATAFDIDEAIKKIYKKTPQPLTLSHCAVAVIGEDIKDEIDEICEYFLNHREISVAIALVRAQKAKEILSLKAESSVAIGYEITDILKTQNIVADKAYNNRFFEARAKLLENKKTDFLPFFTQEQERLVLKEKRK